MKERPILMKGSMVNAILDGRKTQTRRVAKHDITGWGRIGGQGFGWISKNADGDKEIIHSPYQVGQTIWVKETWAYCYKCASGSNGPHDPLVKEGVIYRQQRKEEEGDAWGTCHPINPKTRVEEFHWRPSIFMYRWASRIDLEITEVRVQRVQDISEEDAIAEGLTEYFWPDDLHPEVRARVEGKRYWEHVIKKRSRRCSVWDCPIKAFKELWDDVNARPKPVMRKKKIIGYVSYPWEGIRETREHRGLPWNVYGNPWCWVIEFKRVDAARKRG